MRQKFFLVGLLCLLLSCQALALEVPARPEGRITDLTGTLSSTEKASLERKLADFERETTNQIAVLLIPTLAGDNLEDYSIRLAEKWKVGQKGRNNGVIFLIVKKDRKLRIEVGYGLEGALTDAVSGSIISQEVAPRFKAGQFYQGINAGVSAIMAATRGEYKAPDKKKRHSRSSPWGSYWPILLFFGIFILINAFSRRRRYHSVGSRGWTTGGGFWGGGFSGGGSGGGFSGGGGDFGGGGSSGEW